MRVSHIEFIEDQRGVASAMRPEYLYHAIIRAFFFRHTVLRAEVRDTTRVHTFGA